ncbi:MAG: hypothetical protein NPINA01_14770 [Nitrospinaceae bacterium]|nr:MAG: hypothetical protein NPINA01_14770 [Nitrospinaceae bacterium]
MVLEIFLRFYIDYAIDYYAGKHEPGIRTYPYGTIKINSDGQSDEEFPSVGTKPRIGYAGDSVIYGVGAGQGYRVQDIIRKNVQNADHLTFGALAIGIENPEKLWDLAKTYSLDTIIYFLNLNDILPDEVKKKHQGNFLRRSILFAKKNLDQLRGKSYLYNFFRTKIKTLLILYGYNQSGFQAYELFPEKYSNIFAQTGQRVNATFKKLRENNVNFCVVLLPYEMQISNEAARHYGELGIQWEEGFLNRSAQNRMLEIIDPEVPYLDAYYAFVDVNKAKQSLNENRIGEFFVFDKGDKLDWNHPNRLGHQRIAQRILDQKFCGLN